MLYLAMHKQDWTHEAGHAPDMTFVQEMGAFIGGMVAAGTFRDGAGLGKSANRTRLSFRNGTGTVVRGPFRGSDHEIPHAVYKLAARSRAEAEDWAQKLGRALSTCELEVGKTTESWDLGMEPEPANPPWNALILHKANADTEAGRRPSDAVTAAVERVTSEMKAAGVLEAAITLRPTRHGTRYRLTRAGHRTAVDGPFTESKELVGGFGLFDLPSLAAAKELCSRYADLMLKSVETLEMDLREVDPG